MKDTKRPRETVSSLNYREAEGTPTATVPELKALAGAALALIARGGTDTGETDFDGRTIRRFAETISDGQTMEITFAGVDIPAGIPDRTAHPSDIPYERPWVGDYRLTVRAPLVVMDLYWRGDDPLRIMGFSRGDWEEDLAAMAGADA